MIYSKAAFAEVDNNDYDLISMILTGKLGKISPAEVLKNRE